MYSLKTPGSAASRRKCLLGITITLVEDSMSASEALRLMAVASGARLRRADRLLTAERHLSLYRPNVVIVDIGLPDGSGLELIAKMVGNSPRARPGLIALSGGDVEEWGPLARAAGADALLPKPVGDMLTFQTCVLSVLPVSEGRSINADSVPRVGSSSNLLTRSVKSDDISHALELIKGAETARNVDALTYAAQFVTSIAVMLEDASLQLDARVLLDASGFDGAVPDAIGHLKGQLQARLTKLQEAVG
ncbi:response regulator [Algicella marina]|nr:response regulator [Algicella marina]